MRFWSYWTSFMPTEVGLLWCFGWRIAVGSWEYPRGTQRGADGILQSSVRALWCLPLLCCVHMGCCCHWMPLSCLRSPRGAKKIDRKFSTWVPAECFNTWKFYLLRIWNGKHATLTTACLLRARRGMVSPATTWSSQPFRRRAWTINWRFRNSTLKVCIGSDGIGI